MHMSEPTGDRDPFEVIAESFLAKFRAGERPGIEDLAARHPELADQIRDLLPALVMVEQDLTIDPDPRSNGPQPPPASVPSSERRLGDYRILREIGRGGMGVVYEAEQVSLGRRVALKVLPREVAGDRQSLERFRREAKSAARLHHTNIVPVFEVGRDGELAYYAMQFIQGQGLDKVIDELVRLRDPERKPAGAKSPESTATAKTTRPKESALGRIAESLLSGRFATEGAVPSTDIPPATDAGPGATERPPLDATHTLDLVLSGPEPARPDPTTAAWHSAVLLGGEQGSTAYLSGRRSRYFRSVAQVGRQAAQGLAYAHASGIVHRDVKPSNLLLDHAGVVWIADFGLAKGEDQGLTHTGDILGTLRYMAPERFRGEGDARADVYALGLTLYELLTLRPGFDSPDRLELIEHIKTEEPPKPRSLDARIPRDLETIVLKSIEKDLKARYQSAEALGEDLRRFLADEPIRARPVSAMERYWRWVRRNPGIAAMGGALIALLAATAVGSTIAANYFRNLAVSERLANQRSRQAEEDAVAARQEAIIERDRAQQNEAAERWGRYRSNIAAASAALQVQNSDSARNALDDAPEEHRNWEWRYLHNTIETASLMLRVPGGRVYRLVLSPSGRQIAVCIDSRSEIHLYDVVTGRLEATLRGHLAPVNFVTYRPDGKQLASAGEDQTIRLWDPATGQQTALLKTAVASHQLDHYPVIAFNSDGSRIVSSVFNGGACTSRLWDATLCREIALPTIWQNKYAPACFAPDGKRVVVGKGEYAYLCDAVTGSQFAVLGPHSKAVSTLVYSPDGKRIASSEVDGGSNAIHLWDGETGKEVAVLRGHTARAQLVRFSPDGSRLVSGSGYPEFHARVWDSATGRPLATLAGHRNEIRAIAFSRDGKRVATGSTDQTARLWDLRTGQSLSVLAGHANTISDVDFSPNGTNVVSNSYDGTLRLWNAETGKLISVLCGDGDGLGAPPVFTPDGSHLISGSANGTVRIWDMGLVERNGLLRGHESFVYDVAFGPDGEQVASAGWDGTARLWDATTGRQTGLLNHKTGAIHSISYRSDGRRLATLERERGVVLWDEALRKSAGDWPLVAGTFKMMDGARASLNPAGTLVALASNGLVRLTDTATGHEVAQLKGSVTGSADAAFHPHNGQLAVGSQDGTISLWDVANHTLVAVLRGHSGTVWRVAFSADGKLMASGSLDKSICLWDVQTQRKLAAIPVGSIVYGVAFSPDGTRLAAGCRDTTIRLFDVASRRPVAELRGHTDYVHAVAWSPDGTRLVSGSGDFTVRVWDSLSPADRAKRPNASRTSR
jgi:eukaryotic-like serine/threonine-protein kinase